MGLKPTPSSSISKNYVHTGLIQAQHNPLCLGVLDNVVEGFLCNAVEGFLGIEWKSWLLTEIELDSKFVSTSDSRSMVSESLRQCN